MLDNFFKPGSVAIVGASREKGKIGFSIIDNIIKGGYQGKIYPVNPKADEILGYKVYHKITEIPDTVDLAIVAIPPNFILDLLDECAQKEVKSLIVITAGFKEIGGAGAKLEKELKLKAQKYGIRIIGPNCFGIIDTHSSLNATFGSMPMPQKGKISFFSQSGAINAIILDWAIGANIGLSKFISLGNKADICEIEMMQYLADDPDTNVILGYIEGVENGQKFIEVARETVKKKPLIIAKSGRTSAGARAASSHTGSLAGSDKAYDAAFKQAGIIRANTIKDLFDFAQAFAYQPLPQGSKIAILTNGGGPGILAADACEQNNLELAGISGETLEELKKVLPPTAGFYNPVDIIGDASAERYDNAMNALLKNPNIHGLILLAVPTAQMKATEVADIINKNAKQYSKPILTSLMGDISVRDGIAKLQEYGIPNYFEPELAIKAFTTMINYSKIKDLPPPEIPRFQLDKAKIKSIINLAQLAGVRSLGEIETRELITGCGFSVPKSMLAETSREAVEVAEHIGFPVVMKIASPNILHKSDVGGVKVGLNNFTEIEEWFLKITSNARRYMPTANIWGVTIQEMIKEGKEVIIGMHRDPQFGPLIMFGLGGIYVEVMKDVSFRIAPLTKYDARSMIPEIRSYPLLRGIRGEPPADIECLIDAILRLSQLVTDFPEIQEMDINPLRVRAEGMGCIAIDARFAIKGE